jgi:hypothetical protein
VQHKWAEVVKAWLDGKNVQFKLSEYDDNHWTDYTGHWLNPFDGLGYEWQVKPIKKYRVAACSDENGEFTLSVITDEEEQNATKASYFVKWLTDWVEYD